MLIPVPPRDCYDVPVEGRYRATCIEARESTHKTLKGMEKCLLVIWALPDLSDESNRYLVGKNYPISLANGSALRNDLRTWFGHDVDARDFDTQTLPGKEGIVTVVQIHNEGRPKPCCWVSSVESGAKGEWAKQIGPRFHAGRLHG